MSQLHHVLAAVLVAAASTLAVPAATAAPPDAGAGHLPDSAVIGRVDDRVVRVFDFRDHYFNSPADFRPPSDSLGRVSFLKTMVQKEILGLTARAIAPPLDFEDRQKLREHERAMLLNALYVRAVGDSSTVSDEEIARYSSQFDHELRVREIHFADPDTAASVRRRLLDGRISWQDAVHRYSLVDRGPEGEVGWVKRYNVTGALALGAFALEPGEISPVIPVEALWVLVQCVERRDAVPPPPSTVRRLVARDVREAKAEPLVKRMLADMRAREGAVYDTANILWTIERFREALPPMDAGAGFQLDLRTTVPDIAPADTGRTLIRSPSRRYTVEQFLHAYGAYPQIQRPAATSWAPFLIALDLFFLEPRLVEEARARGLEHDPLVVGELERKTEELQVHHVYQDSILGRVRIDPEQERRYYQENRHRFFSVPHVRYAVFVRPTAEEADSLLERLRAGAVTELVVAADSARGVQSAILEHLENDADVQSLRQLLFEELKPGQAIRVGPDQEGHFGVIQLLNYTASRQMELGEVIEIVRESVYNMESERLLEAFIDRHSAGHRIEARYDQVMRIKLTDPAEDWL